MVTAMSRHPREGVFFLRRDDRKGHRAGLSPDARGGNHLDGFRPPRGGAIPGAEKSSRAIEVITESDSASAALRGSAADPDSSRYNERYSSKKLLGPGRKSPGGKNREVALRIERPDDIGLDRVEIVKPVEENALRHVGGAIGPKAGAPPRQSGHRRPVSPARAFYHKTTDRWQRRSSRSRRDRPAA